METQISAFTAFSGPRRIAAGPIADVALAAKDWLDRGGAPVLVFDDETGQQVDFDLRGTPDEALERLQQHPWLRAQQEQAERRMGPDRPAPDRSGPGRPKLGVISREVSLLPRHWDWLNEQSGGASATLRKLVEERMKASVGRDRARKAHQAAAKFAWIMGGNLPRYEEVARAMSRKDAERFEALIADWPVDIRDHLRMLQQKALQSDQDAGAFLSR